MAQMRRAGMFSQLAKEIAPPLLRALRNYESGDDRRLVAILREHVGDPPLIHRPVDCKLFTGSQFVPCPQLPLRPHIFA